MKSDNLVFAIVLSIAASALFPPQDAYAKTVAVGSGSGSLNYPTAQTTLNLVAGDTMYVNAGTYSDITIGNIAGAQGNPITVQFDPNAVITNTAVAWNSFYNLTYVNFIGLRIETFRYRAMPIRGHCHDLLFKNLRLTNIGDLAICLVDPSNMVFDGTKDSTFYNFKFENMVLDGGGMGITNGGTTVSDKKGVLLDWEISHCSFSNLADTALSLNKCFNLKLHDCSFSDVTSLNHIASLYISGYATVYNNSYTRQWGDDVRAFPLTLNALGYNGPDAVMRFYNNISWEKKKYAMYEHNGVSQTDLDASGGLFSRGSSEIYFNTLYRSRKFDYIAPMVDILFPNVTIKHNLIIEPECDAAFNPSRNYVYQITSQGGNIVADNNLTYATFAMSGLVDAVQFAPSMTSPVRNASNGTVDYITTDHNNHARYVGAADVGAVELQIPGDFNGDDYVDQADYTTWADNYGTDGSVLAVGSRGTNTGAVNQADYTTWADHYGQGTQPAPITVSQPDEPALQAEPAAPMTVEAAAAAVTPAATPAADKALLAKDAALKRALFAEKRAKVMEGLRAKCAARAAQ